jgi:arylsulfatase A-like enzyme
MKYSLTAFAVLTIVGFACSSDNTSDKPNVLFVIFDDLNNFTGYLNGHPQASTPNIDALAANSTCFTNAYSNTPMCAPSRASFFTGIYCHVARDFAWNEHSKHEGYKNNKTLITIFNENGYRTAGVGKLLHWNGRQTWDERGYLDGMKNIYGPAVANKETGEMMGLPSVPMPINSYIDGSWGKLVDFESDPENSHLHYVTDWDGKGKFHFKSETDRDQLHDESTTDWAIETIKKWDSTGLEQPFMLGVGFVRPHTPFHVPAKFYDMFPLEDIQLPEFLINDIEDCHYHDITNPESKGIRYYNELKAAYGDIETGLKHYLQGYLASIAFADEQFGKVINVLNNSRFKDNTIIVITSDHGYQIGQKEYLFKNSMWEESCHIPYWFIRQNSRFLRNVSIRYL